MSQTYQVCKVTVTLPSLGNITTDSAGNQFKHGDKCRVQLYAAKPDTPSGVPFDGYVVGAISFNGYSESPFKRSQKILMPDGYKLLALRVDDDGVPTSWDSLPVHFSGGYIGSPKDVSNGNSRVKHLVCVLSASVNAQNEPDELRQAIANIVNDTIRTATQPGGLLWNNRGGR